ncbi:MAG: hypothetical protein WAM82_23920 [Thermoanaerobaculia bacterium]
MNAQRPPLGAAHPAAAARSKPVGVAVSPDGRRVYVANGHANSVSVIDAATGTLTATIPVGKRWDDRRLHRPRFEDMIGA